MTTNERLARVALTYLTGPGDPRTHHLVDSEGPIAAYRLLNGNRSDWTETPAARRARIALRRTDDRLLIPGEPGWPHTLDLAADTPEHDFVPPLALWAHGTADLPTALTRAVTITGARAATAYGVTVATDIASGCARNGWTVVAGGGFGIDAAAHRAALADDTVTVAVLAGGIDRWYPAGHNALFDRIAQHGLLLTEAPPGTDPTRPRFQARQRLLAALTIGTVLVEAAPRSLSVTTLTTAMTLGRAAMAVPGPVTSALSVACHRMLRDPRVLLVTDAADVLNVIDS
ncbi:DNA-processing protein DprA [Actinoplanes couchii]|uniref:Smf/DprA SLOG domain-containing protein n=1 Tax=Actinoplanes couchii TaxID=403638 RepID=A0ABQ3XRN2_9ACTN|nr:DNA-processing protein DprA [Actinoplanes couchii]MDR6318902.1 DNA processing protein [Actinoplanes couchii]GID61159.1 hypothetical protein Aco03nite_095630 [Actinoplanes couchii]